MPTIIPVGVYRPNPGHTPQAPSQRQTEMQGLISLDIVPRPGTPEFWGSLALAGFGLGAARATAPLRAGMTWVRHPIAKYLSVYQTGTRIGTGARIYLQASKGLRYVNYVAFAMNPLATYHYLKADEYDKAMIQYFGPIGSVWLYNKMTESSKGRSIQPSVVKPAKKTPKASKKKPSKMSSEQKKRLWRMGLRWCRVHNRYDRCASRKSK